MNNEQSSSPFSSAPSRRTFIKQSTAAVVGGALASLAIERSAHAAGSDILKIGLVGCGGRGTGAAGNALRADPHTKLTVLADVFPEPLERCKTSLSREEEYRDRIDVTDDRCFVGFDAYKQVMASDVDVVLLCTTPHFRPMHLRAAVEARKHIFCEKPVAVDAPGVRNVLESVELARENNLNLVSGLCWRYEEGVLATMKRIQDGAIGDIVSIQENYLANSLWHRGRKPEWSEMEYQLRNWLYFTWLSGDHIVEQHIHSLDKALWLMNDEPPMQCFGLGGRQVRTGPQWGNIYDHFSVCYEWPNGVKAFAYTRQMADCMTDTEDYIAGTKGHAQVLAHTVTPRGETPWKYPVGDPGKMYVDEHVALFGAIRSGSVINNGTYMSRSTLMAIMGREACYTGQMIKWDEAMQSTTDLSPEEYAWGDIPVPQVAMPGVTKFV